MSNKTVKFKQWLCKIEKGQYSNNRVVLTLVDATSGEPICTASINIPDVILSDNEIAIKNYSENEGILDDLMREKIVSKPDRYVNSGFVTIPICRLLI